MNKKRIITTLLMLFMLAALFLPAAIMAEDTRLTQNAYSTDLDIQTEESLAFTKTFSTIKAGNKKKLAVNKENVKFTSSNTLIASVSAKGVVKAKRYGTVKITASCEDESVTVKIKVKGKKIIGVDAGHQLKANLNVEPIGPGAYTKKTCVSAGTYGRYSKLKEYQLTLKVAKKLKKVLWNRGYQVVMSRIRHNVNITNRERAIKFNNAGCNVVIHIHADGVTSSAAHGATAIVPASSNPYLSAKTISKSKKLGQSVLKAYCADTKISSRGLSYKNDLTGINWSNCAVMFLELGFMTNQSDDLYMASQSGQKQMVKGIADGIDDYFGY